MTANCISVPVSWLRLERYALGELPESDRATVAAHLAECAACRDCLAGLEAVEGQGSAPLPELPVSMPVSILDAARAARNRRRRRWLLGGALSMAMAAAAAMLVLFHAPADPEGALSGLPGSRVRIKGGELAVTLVRERSGVVERGATTFRDGDRFKVLVTCPPSAGPVNVEVAVVQGRERIHPLGSASPIECGNEVPVEGAFLITGREPAAICVTLERDSACSRLVAVP